MDIDRFIARNQPTWQRLDALTARARRGVRSLAPGELDELVQLYQRTSAHLSHARTYYGDAALTRRLTSLVAAASGVIYGKRARTLRAVGRFFTSTFPAAVWSSRRFVLVAAAFMFVPALALGAWLSTSDRALDAAVPEATQQALLESEFEDYYSSAPAAQFSTEVLINNIQVSMAAFAAGVVLCAGSAYILATNGAYVGIAGGLFVSAGQGGKFFGLILPHGLLELTAIVIAGAAGMRLGWAFIAPGDRTRTEAMADEGRRSVVVVLGLAVAFVVAGIIEAFVTPSGLPTVARVGFGAAVETAFVAYVVVQGRAAVAQGITGALSP